jgi:lipid II:glycine glycyltransferase (peptidoglycan interpeptide bridge formation enzyme)
MKTLNQIRAPGNSQDAARTFAECDFPYLTGTSLKMADLSTADNSGTGSGIEIDVDKVSEGEWSELVDDFDDANIYQTWPYGAVRWGEKNLSHLTLKRGGDVLGIAQLRLVRPRHVRVGVAYLRWGPLCQRRGTELDPEVVSSIAKALREEYVSRRGLYLEILPNAFSGSARAQIFQSAFAEYDHKSGISAEEYRTLVLDLLPALDDLRKQLDKKWRNQLNAAERNDLSITGGDTTEDYRRFCRLYAQMWQRKRFHTAVNIGEFERIQERLPKTQRMRILICEHAGQPVAGLVCSAMGESAIYLLGATNDVGMKVKASYLQQWAMIRSLKEMGVRYYDLGGIDPVANPGVHHFKRGLSGVDVSHIDSFNACDSPFSTALVKTGQIVRRGFRGLRQRISRPQLAEATRPGSMACAGSKGD